MKVDIRSPATTGDLDEALQWMMTEGWQATKVILDASLALDPEGWFVAETDTKQVVGIIATCFFSPDTAFCGFFIVQHDMRGKGIGRKLWEAAWTRVQSRQGVNFGLDSVGEMTVPYMVKGLGVMDFEIYSCEGRLNMDPAEYEYLASAIPGGIAWKSYPGKDHPRHPDLFERILELDTVVHTIERREFLHRIITDPRVHTCVFYYGQAVVGFGCVQMMPNKKWLVGPVYTTRPNTGLCILALCFRKAMLCGAKNVAVSITDKNTPALDFVKRVGLEVQTKLTRLYTKTAIKIDHTKVFGLSTLGVALI